MKCDSCETHQEWLLDNGDGSQVQCDHLTIDDHDTTASPSTSTSPSTQDTSTNTTSTSTSSSTSTTTTIPAAAAAIQKSGKRKFLSPKSFLNLGGDKLKRKIKPIQKWSTLTEGTVYLMRRVVSMEVQMKTGPQIEHYVELENEKEETLNVWITKLILTDSKKYDLTDNDVYIMPLGKTISQEKGFEYNDFVILKDNEVINGQ